MATATLIRKPRRNAEPSASPTSKPTPATALAEPSEDRAAMIAELDGVYSPDGLETCSDRLLRQICEMERQKNDFRERRRLMAEKGPTTTDLPNTPGGIGRVERGATLPTDAEMRSDARRTIGENVPSPPDSPSVRGRRQGRYDNVSTPWDKERDSRNRRLTAEADGLREKAARYFDENEAAFTLVGTTKDEYVNAEVNAASSGANVTQYRHKGGALPGYGGVVGGQTANLSDPDAYPEIPRRKTFYQDEATIEEMKAQEKLQTMSEKTFEGGGSRLSYVQSDVSWMLAEGTKAPAVAKMSEGAEQGGRFSNKGVLFPSNRVEPPVRKLAEVAELAKAPTARADGSGCWWR